MPFTCASTATVCIGSATPFAMTMYGTLVRLTVVTLTGTLGCRGGSDFEHAAARHTANAIPQTVRAEGATRSGELNAFMDELWSGVGEAQENREQKKRECR